MKLSKRRRRKKNTRRKRKTKRNRRNRTFKQRGGGLREIFSLQNWSLRSLWPGNWFNWKFPWWGNGAAPEKPEEKLSKKSPGNAAAVPAQAKLPVLDNTLPTKSTTRPKSSRAPSPFPNQSLTVGGRRKRSRRRRRHKRRTKRKKY